MNVLVTGGAGFIGSHLVDALVERGYGVRVLDNFSSGDLENLEKVRRKIELIRGDIRNEKLLRRSLQGITIVFHQAALRSVPKSVANPIEYHEVNTTATLRLFKFSQECRVRRVVYASSSSIYGDTPLPQKETMIPSPGSPYASSKLAAETYGTMFTRLYGLKTVGLRYFNVFGPRQSLENEYAVVVPKFITCLLKNQRPPIYGDGLQSRDFTYVENVVGANLRAMNAPRAVGRVFNVASGRRYSVRKLAQLLCREINVQVEPRFLPPRAGDVKHTWADISSAKRFLGYWVAVPFVEGLSRTVDWFKAHREAWDRHPPRP